MRKIHTFLSLQRNNAKKILVFAENRDVIKINNWSKMQGLDARLFLDKSDSYEQICKCTQRVVLVDTQNFDINDFLMYCLVNDKRFEDVEFIAGTYVNEDITSTIRRTGLVVRQLENI